MGLADRLRDISPNHPGLPCGIKKILDSLGSEEDKEALTKIMDMRSYPIGVSNRQIHEILIDEGHDIAFASIRLHRSKQCRCYIGKDSERRRQIRSTAINESAKIETKKKVASKRKTQKPKAGK